MKCWLCIPWKTSAFCRVLSSEIVVLLKNIFIFCARGPSGRRGSCAQSSTPECSSIAFHLRPYKGMLSFGGDLKETGETFVACLCPYKTWRVKSDLQPCLGFLCLTLGSTTQRHFGLKRCECHRNNSSPGLFDD